MTNNDDKEEIKAILVGDPGVGKTNLINTCIGKPFDPRSNSSITTSFVEKQFIINNKEYNINLWDTASQEHYKSMNHLFYRGSEIVIFVFDVTSEESLSNLEFWIKNVKDELGQNVVC